MSTSDKLIIAGREFKSRLLVGTGKYPSYESMQESLIASGTDAVTVAMKRVDLKTRTDENILDFIDLEKYLLIPNTSGAMTAEDAIRMARLAESANLPKWIKLEIHPDTQYILPDGTETLKATEILVKEGFVILPYINADPVLARRLAELGASAVMPLGSPIGSGNGLQNREQISIIIEQAKVPVIVDAGIGVPSHASEAFEMGADAVLVNTAIAKAKSPPEMATAFSQSCKAGRTAFLNYPNLSKKPQAQASSPLTGFNS